MAFMNCFLNFNINIGQPGFGFNFGCFSMPNFLQNMPFFSCFNNFYPTSWQPYNNFMQFNAPSVFNVSSNLSMQSFANNYSNYNFNPSWQTNFSGPSFDTFTYQTNTAPIIAGGSSNSRTNKRNYGSLQEQYYKTALSFVGRINSDAEGNARFSNGRGNQWCADFASTLAYETFGNKLPAGFPDAKNHAISTMSIKAWGERHNRYLKLPSSNIASYIAQNVKPGDIMIISRGGGKGHTAIVTKVNSDGTFETVGGNESNSVKKRTRQPQAYQSSGATLIGFVQMGDIA